MSEADQLRKVTAAARGVPNKLGVIVDSLSKLERFKTHFIRELPEFDYKSMVGPTPGIWTIILTRRKPVDPSAN